MFPLADGILFLYSFLGSRALNLLLQWVEGDGRSSSLKSPAKNRLS